MNRIVLAKFNQWTQGKSSLEARVSIYNSIRDIPYAIVPELIDPERYVKIFAVGKGSCSPKHFLLCEMYEKLGMTVLYACYPFRWDEIEIDYPPILRKLASKLPRCLQSGDKQQPRVGRCHHRPSTGKIGAPRN
jgi:hypothetical protein